MKSRVITDFYLSLTVLILSISVSLYLALNIIDFSSIFSPNKKEVIKNIDLPKDQVGIETLSAEEAIQTKAYETQTAKTYAQGISKYLETLESTTDLPSNSLNKAQIKLELDRALQTFSSIDPTNSLSIKELELLLSEAKSKSNEGQYAGLTGILAVRYQIAGEEEKALDYYNTSLTYAEKIEDHAALSNGYQILGLIDWGRGNLESAIDYFERSKLSFDLLGAAPHVARANAMIAFIYQSRNEPEKAIRYHQEALRISEAQGDKETAAGSHFLIGLAYQSQSDRIKAITHYKKALPVFKKIDTEKIRVARIYSYLSMESMSRNQALEAIEFAKKSIIFFEELEALSDRSAINAFLGSIYVVHREPRLAINHLSQALTFYKQQSNSARILYCHYYLGQAYFGLKDWSLAKESYQAALVMSASMGAIKKEAEIYARLGDLNEILGDRTLSMRDYRASLSKYKEAGATEEVKNILKYMNSQSMQ